jgi:DNA modification methylase
MRTEHEVYFSDARQMTPLGAARVDLVVTSPPYPMIQMWDALFSGLDARIGEALSDGRSREAFEGMHVLLDAVWQECYRVLKPGGLACINIGDATRTLAGEFALYPNHARILQALGRIGFTVLPDILWRKPTNAPNKFMGSGMLPAGAYVTLEHEYVLIVRKGGKRVFASTEEKQNRRASALFWEERNTFFSDVWMDLRGTSQVLKNCEARQRSAAFPFEMAYRLVNMFSVRGDVVLDPFWGTGTTSAAAMASGRNSVGLEIDAGLQDSLDRIANGMVDRLNGHLENRLAAHIGFVEQRRAAGNPLKHRNLSYGFPVVTAQEQDLILHGLCEIRRPEAARLTVEYDTMPQAAFCRDWDALLADGNLAKAAPPRSKSRPGRDRGQLKLF